MVVSGEVSWFLVSSTLEWFISSGTLGLKMSRRELNVTCLNLYAEHDLNQFVYF